MRFLVNPDSYREGMTKDSVTLNLIQGLSRIGFRVTPDSYRDGMTKNLFLHEIEASLHHVDPSCTTFHYSRK